MKTNAYIHTNLLCLFMILSFMIAWNTSNKSTQCHQDVCYVYIETDDCLCKCYCELWTIF